MSKETKVANALSKAMGKLDPKGMAKALSTLATNQVYMQENQVEFEQYLKAILENQKNIIKMLEKKDE